MNPSSRVPSRVKPNSLKVPERLDADLQWMLITVKSFISNQKHPFMTSYNKGAGKSIEECLHGGKEG